MLLRNTTGLTCASLLVLTGWIVGSVADLARLIAADGIIVAAVVVIAIVPLLASLLIKSYVAVVYALRMIGAIPAGPLDAPAISRKLVVRAGLDLAE